ERARREAQRAQRRLSRGDSGALLGVPIAVKDLFQTRALRTTAGSRILRDWVPTRDADAVARLRAAGGIIFGKTKLHEFAYGVTTANPWWGIARNPHDPGRSPGGSSGGSAVAGAGLSPGRRSPWCRAFAPAPSARTPAARFASRPPSAAASASSPPLGRSRWAGPSRWGGRSTTPAH